MKDFTVHMEALGDLEQQLLRKLQRHRGKISEAEGILLNGWIRYGSPLQFIEAQARLGEIVRMPDVVEPKPSSRQASQPVQRSGEWREGRRWDYWKGEYVYFWERTTPRGVETRFTDPSREVDQDLLRMVQGTEVSRGRRRRRRKNGSTQQRPINPSF
jgi:hypothetical protein